MKKVIIAGFCILLVLIIGQQYGVICFQYGMLHCKNPSFTHIDSIEDVCKLFPTSVSKIKCYAKNAIVDAQERIEKIKEIAPQARTFENTVKSIDNLEAYSDLMVMMAILQVLELVSPDKSIRDIAHEKFVELEQFAVEYVSHNANLYKALQEYVDHGMHNEQLTQDQRYWIVEQLDMYKRIGLDLPVEKQQVIKALKKELSELGAQFEANIAQDTTKLLFTPEELVGVPQDFINSLKSDDQGNKIVTLAYPTIDAVTKNASLASTRKKMSEAVSKRAYPVNKEILEKILDKRDRLAKELGFAHYADLDLAPQMVTKAAQAQRFLNDLVKRATPKDLQEFAALTKELPESVELSGAGKLFGYDYPYVLNLYKKKHLSVDEDKIAEYFPMEKTVAGLFSIYQQFFGLIFKEVPVSGLWDSSVTGLSIADSDSGEILGYCLLDLYPRENKYHHACHVTIVPATYNADGQPNKEVSLVIANFTKSTATKPSLLRQREVETFFHEFGHALHALLGRTRMASFSGTNVKRDFVELPSQMLEEWLWDKDILQSISSHYQTGEKLPDDQIAAILALKNFDKGYYILRQAFLALLSLRYHQSAVSGDLQQAMKKLYESIVSTIEFSPENHIYTSFGHLTVYGPKYYGYLWSQVFALDLFDKIKKEGLLNPVVGKRYVQQVIGRGGEVDPNVLLEQFLGRKPSQNAFLRNIGL